jgi:outer membrane protein TolC
MFCFSWQSEEWMVMKAFRAVDKILVLILLVVILPGGVFPSLSDAALPEKGFGAKDLPCGQALDFDTCARLAIRQSPFLIRSDLEIKIRRLDETDSRYDFFPSFNLRTRYYLSNPQAGSSTAPYYIDFSSDPYNPVESFFSLQAHKLITRIAILNHLKVISDGLYRLGLFFLQSEAMRQVTQAQTEIIQLNEKYLSYLQARQKIGEGTALEIKVASQELDLARLNHKKLLDGQKKIKESIRTYLAWPANQELSFDLPSSRNQILGNFEAPPDAAEAIASSTFDFKIQALQRELQKYNISLAKARLLPTFYMGVQTPDPLSGTQSRNFFVFAGAFVPLWDGFKRVRNISRQKTVLKQLDAVANETEGNFKEKWREAQENLADLTTQLKMSHSQLELAILKGKQSEMRYNNLGEPFPVSLEGEKGVIESKKNVIMKTLEYDQARFTLRYLANDLVLNYVNENSLPKRSEEKN